MIRGCFSDGGQPRVEAIWRTWNGGIFDPLHPDRGERRVARRFQTSGEQSTASSGFGAPARRGATSPQADEGRIRSNQSRKAPSRRENTEDTKCLMADIFWMSRRGKGL